MGALVPTHHSLPLRAPPSTTWARASRILFLTGGLCTESPAEKYHMPGPDGSTVFSLLGIDTGVTSLHMPHTIAPDI
jgi:hypothetical protein